MCFSIRLLAEEKRIAESYAKMRSMSLEEAFDMYPEFWTH